MKEAFEGSVRKDFEEAARIYQDSRLEPLPAEEWLILEDWISILKQKDEKEVIDILIETFQLTAALSNGFRPSEYMDSMLNSQTRQLRRLQVELDDIAISTAEIHGARGFIEFIIRLRRWLLSDDRSPMFMDGLANDSEYAFWVGCYLKDDDWENAKESFHIAVKGSLTKRMRIRALQNMAWICVHLSEFDDAVSSYAEIIALAEFQDTRELASERRGYIEALRDYGIDEPEAEFMFAPTPAEFEESAAVRQASEILESLQLKGETLTTSRTPSHLQKWIEEVGGVDREVRQRLTQQLGFEVDELPSEIVDDLVHAERLRLSKRSPREAISDLHQATANCLQWYIGTPFIPYARKKARNLPQYKTLAVNQWSIILGSLSERGHKPIREPNLRLLATLFRSFLTDNSSWHNRAIFLSLGSNLSRIQQIRNPHRHREGDIASGPPSRTQQLEALEEMHRLVIGQQDPNSAINQIIRLDISKKT